MEFTEVWTLPFKADAGGYSSYIWDSSNHMCFSYLGSNYVSHEEDYKTYRRIIDLMNGNNVDPFKDVFINHSYIVIGDDEFLGSPALMVRGWGHLTGCGALNLHEVEALRLQRQLEEYCVEKLKGNNTNI